MLFGLSPRRVPEVFLPLEPAKASREAGRKYNLSPARLRPRLFKRRVALSNEWITIQWISIRETDCVIH